MVRVVLGIVLIAVAGMYPLWAMYRLNKRLGRPDGPSSRQLAVWLAFTLSFPFALALTGAALVAPALAQSPLYRAVVGGLWGFVAVTVGARLMSND
ncbi:MAG: hypothetical protein GXO55_11150 [Chloroflexi bacterium]|nr:hypothetical protein [Chloroflexota bacterium]